MGTSITLNNLFVPGPGYVIDQETVLADENLSAGQLVALASAKIIAYDTASGFATGADTLYGVMAEACDAATVSADKAGAVIKFGTLNEAKLVFASTSDDTIANTKVAARALGLYWKQAVAE